MVKRLTSEDIKAAEKEIENLRPFGNRSLCSFWRKKKETKGSIEDISAFLINEEQEEEQDKTHTKPKVVKNDYNLLGK
jgi:hypothetical protein